MMHGQSRSCVGPITSTQDLTYQDPGRASAFSDVLLSKEDVSMAVQETWAGGVVEAVHRTLTRIREYRNDLSLDEEDHGVLSDQLSITSEVQRLGKAEQSLHWQLQQADSLLVNRLREGVDVKAAVIGLMEDLQKTSELYDGEDASLISQQFSIQSEMLRLRDLEKDLHLQLEQAHLGGEVQDVSPTRWRVDDASDDATSSSPITRSDVSIASDRTWELIWDARLPTAAMRSPWCWVGGNSSNRVSMPPASIKKGIFSSPIKGSNPVPSLDHQPPKTMDTASTTSSFSSIPFHLPTSDPHVLVDAPLYSLDPIFVELGDSLSAPTVCPDIESEFEEWMRIRELRDTEQDVPVCMFSQQELSVGSEIQRLDDLDKYVLSSQFQEAHCDGESQQVPTHIRDGRPSLRCMGDSVRSSDSEHSLSSVCEPVGAILCTLETSCLEIWQQDIDSMERGTLRQDENTCPFSFSTTRARELDLNVANKYHVYALASHGVWPKTMEPTAEIEKGILSPIIICSSSPSPGPSMYHDESPETMDTTSVTVTEHTGVTSPIHLRYSNALGDDDASVDDSASALSPGCSIVESSKSGSLLNAVANVLFGDSESLAQTFSSHRLLYRRNVANKYHVYALTSHGVSPTMEPTADIEKGISSPILICRSSLSSVPSMYHESPKTMDTTSMTVTEHTGVLPASPIHLRFSNHKMPLETVRIAPHEALGDDDASVDDSVSALSPGCSIMESSSKGGSLLNTVANVLFGDTEYLVQTFFSSTHNHRLVLYRRSYQGGASFGMATAFICMQLHIHFAFLLPLPAVAILPMVAVWVEVHTPHDVDEATLAVCATILSLSIKLFTYYSSSSLVRETNILIA
jgi:hypothetical protein